MEALDEVRNFLHQTNCGAELMQDADSQRVRDLGILHKFRIGGHIDPDLFDIFVNQSAHRRYAEQFLDP